MRGLGFVTNMHELMSIADLILTKPGGLTSSEALALGKPLFMADWPGKIPLGNTEKLNHQFKGLQLVPPVQVVVLQHLELVVTR